MFDVLPFIGPIIPAPIVRTHVLMRMVRSLRYIFVAFPIYAVIMGLRR
jgi:hypothetical protein